MVLCAYSREIILLRKLMILTKKGGYFFMKYVSTTQYQIY